MTIDTVSGVVAGGVGWGLDQFFHSVSSAVFSQKTPEIYLYRNNEMYIDTGEYVLELPPDKFRDLIYALDNGLWRDVKEILEELAQVGTSRTLESDASEP
jgi:hypothetical protein